MIWGGGRFFSTVRSLQDLLIKWPQNRHLGSSPRLSWGSGTGCWSWWGAVTPDITHRRISSLANTLLPLSGLRWPQHLKHSLYDP